MSDPGVGDDPSLVGDADLILVGGHPSLVGDADLILDGDLERTEFAWVRSGLALAVIGLLLLKRLLPLVGHRVAQGFIIIGLGVSFAAIGVAFERHRRHRELPSRSALKLVSLSTVVIGLAALVLAVVSTA
jgi:uncharacterized membrane protein YidH (DUF202 family)